MPDPTAYPGPQFWDDVYLEFERTDVSTVAAFNRDEMPWVLARFSLAWESLEVLDDEVPHARFATFVALSDYRYVITGYRWASGPVELLDFEVITWNHPDIEPG